MKITPAIVGALLTLLVGSSCAHFQKMVSQQSIDGFLGRLTERNNKIHQIRSMLDIHAHGLWGKFFHEEADLIVKEPHSIYWSLRSFLGSPSLVVASNGRMITMLDASDGRMEVQEFPKNGEVPFKIFDFPFYPTMLAELLLAKVPLEEMKSMELFERNARIKLKAHLPNGWYVESEFDNHTALPLSTVMANISEKTSYQMVYQSPQVIDGIAFPTVHVLHARVDAKDVKMTMKFSDTHINGQPMKDEVFELRPY